MGSRWKLHRSIVTGICNRLVHIPNIEELNLGHWSCRKFSLLADHNQIDGWPLEYLSQLTVLRLQVLVGFLPSVKCFALHNKRNVKENIIM